MIGLATEEMRSMAILGMDWGARRIGFAVKPAGMDYVLPRGVVMVGNEQEAVRVVRAVIEEAAAGAIVVGIPLYRDPAQAQIIRRFCRRTRCGIRGTRWFFTDEYLTTQAADSMSRNSLAGKETDDLAAKLILESWLQEAGFD